MAYLKNSQFWIAALATFFTSISSAAIVGALVFLITDFFGLEKRYISIYIVSGMIAGMLIAPAIGRYTDRGLNQQTLMLMLTAVANLIGFVIFYFSDSYWVIFAINITLFAVGSSSSFLIISYATIQSRMFGERAKEAVMFNRAMISLAWVVGPGLSGFIVADYGFKTLFVAMIIFSMIGLLLVMKLPPLALKLNTEEKIADKNLLYEKLTTEAMFLLVVFWLLHSVIAAIIVLLPLHIIDLGGSEKHTGIAFSIAAFVEIPILIFVARFLNLLGNKKMLYLLFVLAAVSFTVTGSATNLTQLYLLQILSGIMIALCIGIGMTLIQDTMPNSPATILAYYGVMFRFSVIVGSGLAGFLAEDIMAGQLLIYCSAFPLIGLMLIWYYYNKTKKAVIA